MWSQKKAGLYPCTRQISPYSCLLSRGQQQFRPVAPGCASTKSQMLAPLFVMPGALCCAPWPPPHPSPWAGTLLVWPHLMACWATGSPQRLPPGPLWLYRNTLKAFTSILNGHVYLSPPVANTNRQAIFHIFVELWEGVIHSKHFWFHSMEKSEHFLRYDFSDLFWMFIDQILPKVFLFYSMDTTGSRKISSAIDV